MSSSSPVHMTKYENVMSFNGGVSNGGGGGVTTVNNCGNITLGNQQTGNVNNLSPSNSNMAKMMDQNLLSPPQVELEEFVSI